MINACGPGALIDKFDVQSAFRILDVHPDFWKFLVFQFDDKFYFETVMLFWAS